MKYLLLLLIGVLGTWGVGPAAQAQLRIEVTEGANPPDLPPRLRYLVRLGVIERIQVGRTSATLVVGSKYLAGAPADQRALRRQVADYVRSKDSATVELAVLDSSGGLIDREPIVP